MACKAGRDDLSTQDPADDPSVADTARPADGAGRPDIGPLLQAWLPFVLALRFDEVQRVNDEMLRLGAPRCPDWRATSFGRLWNQECITSDDTRFSGSYGEIVTDVSDGFSYTERPAAHLAALDATFADWDREASASTVTIHQFRANAQAELASGRTVFLSGDFWQLAARWPGNFEVREITLEGTWWDVTQDDRPALGIHLADVTAPDSRRSVWAQGPVTVDGAVVHANGVILSTPEATCASEPSGSFDIRDAHGVWRTASFDAQDGGPCDACGQVYEASVLVGSFCADLTLPAAEAR